MERGHRPDDVIDYECDVHGRPLQENDTVFCRIVCHSHEKFIRGKVQKFEDHKIVVKSRDNKIYTMEPKKVVFIHNNS